MKTKVLLIIMSHLSDVQEIAKFNNPKMIWDINDNINFVKYLAMKYVKDLTVEIDPDAEYQRYVDLMAAKIDATVY